jgi:hypothetical protein
MVREKGKKGEIVRADGMSSTLLNESPLYS